MIPLFFHKSPRLLKKIYKDFVWDIPTTDKVVYLTFDDGPIPNITEWVLEQLAQYQAKATFFCVGDNIVKYPHILQKILADGHTVGNHTHNHLKGWETDNELYWENIAQCQAVLNTSSYLFRPPYGRIKLSQAKPLLESYKIIMWDVLSGDFEKYLTPQRCLQKTIQHIRPGSIVVLHDSIKAWQNMSYVLPRLLDHLAHEGYQFEALTHDVFDEVLA